MRLLKGTTLKNKYEIVSSYDLSGYIASYIGKMGNDDIFICHFLDRSLIENEIALEYYDKFEKIFWNNIDFLKKMNLKNFPSFIEAFDDEDGKIAIFKKEDFILINDYLLTRSENFSYKECHYILKNLFVNLNIAYLGNLYFDLEKYAAFNLEKQVCVSGPLTLNSDKNKLIKSMANLYYKLLTGVSFFEIMKKPSDLGIQVPSEVEIFLVDILLDKKIFLSVELFINEFRDLIDFSNLKKDTISSNIDSKNEKSGCTGCFVIIFIILALITSLYFASKPLIGLIKVGFNNMISSFEEETVYDDSSVEEFSASEFYNLDYSVSNFINNIEEKDGFIYYSLYSDNKYSLFKESIETGKKDVLKEDLLANHIFVFKDTIYFSNGIDENKLYSIKTDGSDFKKIVDKTSSYIQIESDGNIGYFVTYDKDKELYTINKFNLTDYKDEVFTLETDSYKFYYYLDMYDILKEKFIDKSLEIKAITDYYSYQLYKNILLYSNYDNENKSDKIFALDFEGNSKVFPFNIPAIEFKVFGDEIIYLDYDSLTLKSFNFQDKGTKNLFGEIYSILKVTSNDIFVLDSEEKRIIRLDRKSGIEDLEVKETFFIESN